MSGTASTVPDPSPVYPPVAERTTGITAIGPAELWNQLAIASDAGTPRTPHRTLNLLPDRPRGAHIWGFLVRLTVAPLQSLLLKKKQEKGLNRAVESPYSGASRALKGCRELFQATNRFTIQKAVLRRKFCIEDSVQFRSLISYTIEETVLVRT